MFVFRESVVVVFTETRVRERVHFAFKSGVQMTGAAVTFRVAEIRRTTKPGPFAVPRTGKSVFSEGFAAGNRPPIPDRD